MRNEGMDTTEWRHRYGYLGMEAPICTPRNGGINMDTLEWRHRHAVMQYSMPPGALLGNMRVMRELYIEP